MAQSRRRRFAAHYRSAAVTIERFADGVTIKVPAAGLFAGTQGLFVFALIWNGIIGVITVVALAVFFDTAPGRHDQAIWWHPAILSIFWLVGLGMLLGSINMGLRQAAMAVTGGTLMVIQTGLFGSKQRNWQPGEVDRAGVAIGHDGQRQAGAGAADYRCPRTKDSVVGRAAG